MQSSIKDNKNNLSMLLIFLIIFLDMVGVGIIIPVLAPLLLSHTGILPANYSDSLRTIILGFLIATYPLAQFFGAPLLGGWSDRVGRKKVLLVSLGGTFIGYIIFAIGIYTQNILLLFISRIIDGFTGGNISIVLSAIADISDEKSKARNFGMVGMAFGLGFILGPFLGGKLSDPHLLPWFNFATPFWFAALLALVNILFVNLKFKETLSTKIQSEISIFTGFRNLKKAFLMENLRIMFFVVFLLAFGFSFFAQFFQVFLIDKFSYTQSEIGNLFGYIGLWIAFSQGIVTRFFSGRFKSHQILPFSALFLGLTMPFLLIPSKAIYLYFILPFIAVFNGLTYPNSTAIISNLSSKESQGEILGINQSIQSLAQAIPPIIAGFIVTLNRSLPIIVSGIMILFAWGIFMLFFKAEKKEKFVDA